MAHATPRWSQVLPFVLLGLRSVIKEDINATAAELVFEPSTTKDPPCRAAMHVKSVEAETSSRWCGVVVRRGVPAQVSSTSLDHGSKLRGPSPKALV
ncbi:hypothetical protein TNCV_2470071 [Trichonephila clavipes]|nr:hypothetical protein TNCV_2470071 [Trichonephila clavipes]